MASESDATDGTSNVDGITTEAGGPAVPNGADAEPAVAEGSAAEQAVGGPETSTGEAASDDAAARGAATNPMDGAYDSAAVDPAFQDVVADVDRIADRERSHPPSEVAAADAQLAAESPTEELTSRAAAEQTDEIGEREPGPFDREALKKTLLDRIDDTAPETLEDADQFADDNELGGVKRGLEGAVANERDRTRDPVEEPIREPPDPSGIEPKESAPLEAPETGSPPPDVGAERAAPKPKPETAVEAPMAQRSASLDRTLERENVTDGQLESANEPSFTRALDAKRDAQSHSAEAPDAYRAHEQGVLSDARASAGAIARNGTASMHDDRARLLTEVSDSQQRTKREDERTREEIAADIHAIYDRTAERVTDRLGRLDDEVSETFDEGAEAARSIFEEYVEVRMRAYKAERYSGVGAALWVKDKLMGLPDEVKAFYVEGRERYLEAMDETIDRVVDVLATGIQDAKELVADGREEIGEYLADLPESLRAVGEEAAGEIRGQFDELEARVEARKNDLVDSLARKYNESVQEADDRIEELRAENRGLVDAAFDAIAGVVRTITQLKTLLLGVLAKAAEAATTILTDPIGFLGKLVTGVGRGIEQFADNIWTHLRTGLLDWLTGAVEAAGIDLPDAFDLQGAFSVVLQVLGLTYENVREQVVNVLGEDVVERLEEGFEVFRTMITDGVGGLWEYVKDRLAGLRDRVLDEIRSLVATEVIEAGVKWLLGLLGPVGAFIKACKTIYDVVAFFVQRAQEVLKLVTAFLDSVLAIAQGSLGRVAGLIEDALARTIPVLIGLLASLIGLGDLPKKVESVIATVRKPIDDAIRWVIERAEEFVHKAGETLGIGDAPDDEGRGDGGDGGDDRTESDRRRDLRNAKAEVDALLRKPSESVASIRAALPEIAAAYGLTSLELRTHESDGPAVDVWADGVINPEFSTEPVRISDEENDEISVLVKKHPSVSQEMRRIGDMYPAHAADILSVYDQIAHIEGAEHFLRDLIAGDTTAKGALGELTVIKRRVDAGEDIVRVADRQPNPETGTLEKAADYVIGGEIAVDVKDLDLRSSFYQTAFGSGRLKANLLSQVERHRRRYPGKSIRFEFLVAEAAPEGTVRRVLDEVQEEADVSVEFVPL